MNIDPNEFLVLIDYGPHRGERVVRRRLAPKRFTTLFGEVAEWREGQAVVVEDPKAAALATTAARNGRETRDREVGRQVGEWRKREAE